MLDEAIEYLKQLQLQVQVCDSVRNLRPFSTETSECRRSVPVVACTS